MQIYIQEVKVPNGERPPKNIVPVYHALVTIPVQEYFKSGAIDRANRLCTAAQDRGVESSVVTPIAVPQYRTHHFLVSSPDRQHTISIVEAICRGFEIQANII